MEPSSLCKPPSTPPHKPPNIMRALWSMKPVNKGNHQSLTPSFPITTLSFNHCWYRSMSRPNSAMSFLVSSQKRWNTVAVAAAARPTDGPQRQSDDHLDAPPLPHLLPPR